MCFNFALLATMQNAGGMREPSSQETQEATKSIVVKSPSLCIDFKLLDQKALTMCGYGWGITTIGGNTAWAIQISSCNNDVNLDLYLTYSISCLPFYILHLYFIFQILHFTFCILHLISYTISIVHTLHLTSYIFWISKCDTYTEQ